MFSRKCSSAKPSHNIGVFFNTIGQNRKSRPCGGMSALSRIVLQKAFWGAGQNFSGPLMPFAHGDMRDHTVSHTSDHGASYGRYAALQWRSRLKISFCEIFGVVRFSTFATLSGEERKLDFGAVSPLMTQNGLRLLSSRC